MRKNILDNILSNYLKYLTAIMAHLHNLVDRLLNCTYFLNERYNYFFLECIQN